MNDPFQQKPHRALLWDSVRDRERAKKIRLLQLPTLEAEAEKHGGGKNGELQEETEVQATERATTNTSRNISPRVESNAQEEEHLIGECCGPRRSGPLLSSKQ